VTQSSDWTAPGDRAADADLPADDAPDLGRRPDPDVAPPDEFELPKPDGWTDPLSGTDGPRFWDRVVESENARWRRYGRPVTVVVVEFTGLVSDGTWLGRELVMQTFARVAQVLTMAFRSSDYQARIGPGRFGILLIDTDEISAINFVDRIRAACQNELDEHSGFGMRTGWASPAEGETLHSAVDRARARLDDPAFQGTA
jgi:diguanylate cyclase